jgi:uncharacterized protein YbcI
MASPEIARGAVQTLREYTGRGPTKAHTVINRDSVMILLGDTLTKGERSLVKMGMADDVLETRRRYQMAMQEDLVGLVEAVTGRNVVAFMSDNHIDPDLAAEVFILEADTSNHEAGSEAEDGREPLRPPPGH